MRQIAPLTYTGITPTRMDLIRIRAKSQGLVLTGSKGLASWDHGSGVDWVYDENRETLTVKLAIPFSVSDQEAEGAISSIVRQTAPGSPQDEAHGLSPKDAVDARKTLDAADALDDYNAREKPVNGNAAHYLASRGPGSLSTDSVPPGTKTPTTTPEVVERHPVEDIVIEEKTEHEAAVKA